MPMGETGVFIAKFLFASLIHITAMRNVLVAIEAFVVAAIWNSEAKRSLATCMSPRPGHTELVKTGIFASTL